MDETKFEDYMTLGPLKAVDVIREITGVDGVNPVGYCIGGTLLREAQRAGAVSKSGAPPRSRT